MIMHVNRLPIDGLAHHTPKITPRLFPQGGYREEVINNNK